MNILKTLDQFCEKCVHFCDSIRNNVMSDGNFIRIIYSTEHMTLNGVYLLLELNDITLDKYYNKYKCNFNINANNDIINKVKIIEELILQKYLIRNKSPQYKIYEQLKNGNIKIFVDINTINNNKFALKISGIWETQSHYGLTYKFIKITE